MIFPENVEICINFTFYEKIFAKIFCYSKTFCHLCGVIKSKRIENCIN